MDEEIAVRVRVRQPTEQAAGCSFPEAATHADVAADLNGRPLAGLVAEPGKVTHSIPRPDSSISGPSRARDAWGSLGRPTPQQVPGSAAHKPSALVRCEQQRRRGSQPPAPRLDINGEEHTRLSDSSTLNGPGAAKPPDLPCCQLLRTCRRWRTRGSSNTPLRLHARGNNQTARSLVSALAASTLIRAQPTGPLPKPPKQTQIIRPRTAPSQLLQCNQWSSILAFNASSAIEDTQA